MANQGPVMTFLSNLEVIGILCSLRLVLLGKTGRETPESPTLDFLEKISANNLDLLDAEENTPEQVQ